VNTVNRRSEMVDAIRSMAKLDDLDDRKLITELAKRFNEYDRMKAGLERIAVALAGGAPPPACFEPRPEILAAQVETLVGSQRALRRVSEALKRLEESQQAITADSLRLELGLT
jgi:hypothetical protein